MIKVERFNVSERLARLAKEAISFSDYKENTATFEYLGKVEEFENAINDLLDNCNKQLDENQMQLIQYYANRYSERLAQAIDDNNRNTASCPSVMVAGGSKFPTRKKEKQNARADALWEKNGELFNATDNYYYKKIKNILDNDLILSGDINALENLESKLERLKEEHKEMLEVNKYYKKYHNLDNLPMQIFNKIRLLAMQNIEFYKKYYVLDEERLAKLLPFPTYELSSIRQKIKNTEKRIENLMQLKATANTYEYPQIDGVEVVEDAETMRLQIIFDDIPDAETRNKLKHSGFHWSPHNKAWQRVLTDNARYTTKKLLEEFKNDK